MGWELRHGRRYFYHYRRTDSGVVVDYYGRGWAASRAAAEIAAAAEERRDEGATLRATEAVLRPLDAHLDLLSLACRDLADGSLLAAGYHRPNYRPWRKRRDF